MAAAEARAAWQRAANRCFVQEDAKRAPKLPPSSSQHTNTNANASANANANTNTNINANANANTNTNHPTNSQSHCFHDRDDNHQLILNLTPLNWSPYPTSTTNLPADTRWWLQLHPNFTYQREFLLYEHKNHMSSHPATTNLISPSSDFDLDHTDPPKISHRMSFVKHASSVDKNVEDGKLSCDAISWEEPLMLKKREPWWRVADGEELASMVAQKAAQHVENCDLPRPTQTSCYSSTKVGMVAFGSANLYSACDNGNGPSRKGFDMETDLKPHMECATRCMSERQSNGREELLEALCHSQTRAREAEIAAKKALSEKEDIMKLLFKQASHLFACKQWLKMLQLENLCLQLRIRDHHFPLLPFYSKLAVPPSTPSPSPPSTPRINSKPSKACNSFCRYVVVFAVGWGLAGAGLLLGWTLGRLLPKL